MLDPGGQANQGRCRKGRTHGSLLTRTRIETARKAGGSRIASARTRAAHQRSLDVQDRALTRAVPTGVASGLPTFRERALCLRIPEGRGPRPLALDPGSRRRAPRPLALEPAPRRRAPRPLALGPASRRRAPRPLAPAPASRRRAPALLALEPAPRQRGLRPPALDPGSRRRAPPPFALDSASRRRAPPPLALDLKSSVHAPRRVWSAEKNPCTVRNVTRKGAPWRRSRDPSTPAL